jgi:hypothetical protein
LCREMIGYCFPAEITIANATGKAVDVSLGDYFPACSRSGKIRSGFAKV